MSNKKKCVVVYKNHASQNLVPRSARHKTVLKDGEVHDHKFRTLKQCCTTFGARFNETFFIKARQGFPYAVDGINFVSMDGDPKVVLYFSRGAVPSENEMKFCPFCGAVIELKEIPL